MTSLAIISSALPPDFFTVDARFPAGIDARLHPEVVCRSDGYVEERQRRNGLVILVGEICAGLLKPVDNLTSVRRVQLDCATKSKLTASSTQSRGSSPPRLSKNHRTSSGTS